MSFVEKHLYKNNKIAESVNDALKLDDFLESKCLEEDIEFIQRLVDFIFAFETESLCSGPLQNFHKGCQDGLKGHENLCLVSASFGGFTAEIAPFLALWRSGVVEVTTHFFYTLILDTLPASFRVIFE